MRETGAGRSLAARLLLTLPILALFSAVAVLLGLSGGSSGLNLPGTLALLCGQPSDPTFATIVWQIRLPRVILGATVGATLALGGLVFQALLRNPLAEPYILGVSGGSAVGAIIGMFAGLAVFPGVVAMSFGGSLVTLLLVLLLAGARLQRERDALLLGGVMMNAFCSAVIMFLLAISQSTQAHHILFWLMGDLTIMSGQGAHTLWAVLPCLVGVLLCARSMNLLLLGRETAVTLGLDARRLTFFLLVLTSLMVSIVVSQAGLVGFVGLVVPHLLRLLLGPDHRLLAPACILGGAGYLVLCDLLARSLPREGEMPVGVVTALIGAPLFIALLWRSKR